MIFPKQNFVAHTGPMWDSLKKWQAPSSELVAAARSSIASLGKSFPGAFMPFTGELAKLLPESSPEDAKVWELGAGNINRFVGLTKEMMLVEG